MNKGNQKILDTVEKHPKDRFTKYSSHLNVEIKEGKKTS